MGGGEKGAGHEFLLSGINISAGDVGDWRESKFVSGHQQLCWKKEGRLRARAAELEKHHNHENHNPA